MKKSGTKSLRNSRKPRNKQPPNKRHKSKKDYRRKKTIDKDEWVVAVGDPNNEDIHFFSFDSRKDASGFVCALPQSYFSNIAFGKVKQ